MIGLYKDGEWRLDHIVTHKWHGQKVKFLIQWKTGDQNVGFASLSLLVDAMISLLYR